MNRLALPVNRLALLLFIAGVAWLASSPTAVGLGGKPGMTITTKKSEIDMLGTAGPIAFSLTDLKKGQKLPATGDWVKKLDIGGTVIKPAGLTLDSSDGGTKGTIIAIPKSGPKPGKHKVKLTVELNDGTLITGEAVVEFVPAGGSSTVVPCTALAPHRDKGRRKGAALM